MNDQMAQKTSINQWVTNWKQHSRYREVANVCVPLVMGTAATTVMEFTDRVFLANYSLEAIAAAMPSGIAASKTLRPSILKYCAWGPCFPSASTPFPRFLPAGGATRPVMIVTLLGMAFNIPLDYLLINGIWIFPELGIAGAAIATVASWALMALLFSLLIFTPTNEKNYSVKRSRLLHIVAIYLFLDALYMSFVGVLKGAGEMETHAGNRYELERCHWGRITIKGMILSKVGIIPRKKEACLDGVY